MGNLYRFVEPVVLLLLKSKGRSYGYDLCPELQAHALTDAEIERAALYRTLRQLEMNGGLRRNLWVKLAGWVAIVSAMTMRPREDSACGPSSRTATKSACSVPSSVGEPKDTHDDRPQTPDFTQGPRGCGKPKANWFRKKDSGRGLGLSRNMRFIKGLANRPEVLPGRPTHEFRRRGMNGNVVSEWQTDRSGPVRRVYKLTAKGEEHLYEWAEVLGHVSRSMARFVKQARSLQKA